MNVVIYSLDFEPITVLDIPLDFLESMERKGAGRLVVRDPNNPDTPTGRECIVLCRKIGWIDGTTKTILLTQNEEDMLILKPDWLPGQRNVHNQYVNQVTQLTGALLEIKRKQKP